MRRWMLILTICVSSSWGCARIGFDARAEGEQHDAAPYVEDAGLGDSFASLDMQTKDALSGRADAPQAPDPWVQRSLLGSGLDVGRDLVLDRNGNLYAVGSFEDKINLGGDDLSSVGRADVFVASYTVAGEHRWSTRFGGVGVDIARRVTVDSAGNIYVVGQFKNSMRLGAQELLGTQDAGFVVSFSPRGSVRWWRVFDGPEGDRALDVAVDADRNVYVTGYFVGEMDCGATLPGRGDHDVFVGSYTSGGVFRWAASAGGAGGDDGVAIAVRDQVYVSGYFSGSASFGTSTLTSAGGNDVFLASYARNGTMRWVKRLGGTLDDEGKALAVDSTENVVLAGFFYGSADFGDGPVVAAGERDLFVASYDTKGVYRWGLTAGDTLDDAPAGIAIDAQDNVFVTGYFYGSVDLGGVELTSAGIADIFVASFTQAGAARGALRLGGADHDEGYGVALDNTTGAAYLAGTFGGTVDFGLGPEPSAGSVDVFVMQLP